jgi:hypothetical protein
MPNIYIKDYDTSVNFPDTMSGEEIQSVLQKQFPVKQDRSLLEKAASWVTMGHVGGEAGPDAEVKFTPSGEMAKQNVESGSDWVNDPITGLAMGLGGGIAKSVAGSGLKEAGKFAAREAAGWLTGGATEVPGIAIAAGKGAVNLGKKVLDKDMAPKAAKVAKPAPRSIFEGMSEGAPGQNIPSFPVAEKAPGLVDQFMEAPMSSPLDAVIPEVRGGMAGELPKYAEGSSINLERLNTTEDLKQFLNAKTADIEQVIGKRHITMEETRAQAEALGWNGADAVNAFTRKGSMTAAEMDATRQLNVNSIDDLYTKIKNLPPGRTTLTPELRAQYMDAMDLVKATSQASSEAGRLLNIHKRVLSNDPQFAATSLMNKTMKKLEGVGGERTDDIINAMKDLDFTDPLAVNKFVYGVTRTKWDKLSDGAYELYMNGLLSNPLTHIVNTTSNALTGLYTIPERLLGTGIEAVSAKLAGRQREMFAGEAAADLFSLRKGIVDGISRFGTALKKGDAMGKLENVPISALPESIQPYMPTRALSAEDAFFKGVIENSELNRLAYREAAKKGLKGQQLRDEIVNTLAAPTNDILEKAAARGKYLTYQQELGRIGNQVMKLRNDIPGLKYLFPFVKTPTNIFKFAMERSPLGFLSVLKQAYKGELKGAELSEKLARPLMGTILGTTVYQLAEDGYITGGSPKQAGERNERANVGWQPYSVKIGDTYYGFNRAEPLATIMGMAADLSAIKREASEDDKFKLGSALMGALTENVINKTFMQSLSNIVKAINDPGRYGANFANGLVSSVVPAVAGGVERAADPYQREVRNPIDAIKAKIPGVASTLPVKLTAWGDPVERPGTALTRSLSPVPISEVKGSPIEQEMTKMKFDVGMPSKKIGNVELEPEEYWQYVAEARQPAKQLLDMLAQSENWKNMPEDMREKQVKSVVSRFQDIAHKQLAVRLLREGRLKTETQKDMTFLYNTLK